MCPLPQPGLAHAALQAYRLGQSLDALFAAHLNRVFGAIALNALEGYALSPPWLQQDTTTLTLYGAYAGEARQECQSPQASERPIPPRPASGHSKDGHDDLKQVLLSLGVSSEGLPLRVGMRDGNTSDSTEIPVAMEECRALGLDGVRGIVADSKAYCPSQGSRAAGRAQAGCGSAVVCLRRRCGGSHRRL
jgi:transposase